jgi:hypothetical protein
MFQQNQLVQNFGTRLPKHLAEAVRTFAESNAISESAAIRIALANFFATPRASLIETNNREEDLQAPVQPALEG